MTLYDKNGREIHEFDLLKMFHFVGPRNKKNFIYKWVRKINGDLAGLHLTPSGGEFWLKAVADENNVLQDCEIVQGFQDHESFESRPKIKGNVCHSHK